jgi:excisionase family DNA binding protein
MIMNEIMTEQEAAKYLRQSTKTLQRRRRDGQISFIRDGGIRYLLSDLDAYIDARRTVATKAPCAAPAPKYRPLSRRAQLHQDALIDII